MNDQSSSKTKRAGLRVLCGLVVLALTSGLAACGANAGGSRDGTPPDGSGVETMLTEETLHEESLVKITDFTVAGPAISADHGANEVNRLGSAEVAVRVYEPEAAAWATLVWAHGGSFVHGNLDWPESDWVARGFADEGVRVVAVDYALASETVKAPGPANDIAAVLAWASAEYDSRLFLGGASAGANLAITAALTLPDAVQKPAGVLLLYPTLHRVQEERADISQLTADLAEQRRFGPTRVQEMYEFYLGSPELPEAREFSASGYNITPFVVGEVGLEELAALPPVMILNAEVDDLRASGEQFAAQLNAAGVEVAVDTLPEVIHGYINRPDEYDLNRRAAERTIESFAGWLRSL